MEIQTFKLGQVKVRRDGRYFVEYYVLDPSINKLKRIKLYIPNYPTKKQRKEHAAYTCNQVNENLMNGWNPFTSKLNNNRYMSVTKALDKALKIKDGSVKQKTLTSYKTAINQFKEYLLKSNKIDKQIKDISRDIAYEYLDYFVELQGGDVSPSTYNNRMTYMKSIFTSLQERGFIDKNPFDGIKKKKVDTVKKRPFTHAELTLYTRYLYVNDYNFYVCSMLCYACALRPGEIVKIKKGNINLEAAYIYLYRKDQKAQLSQAVSMPNDLMKELKKYLQIVPTDDHYLFSSGIKPGLRQINGTRISERFRETAKYLKLDPALQFYCLKDTAADNLVGAGFDIKSIRDHYRHSDVNMTDIYLKRVNPENQVNSRIVTEYPFDGFYKT